MRPPAIVGCWRSSSITERLPTRCTNTTKTQVLQETRTSKKTRAGQMPPNGHHLLAGVRAAGRSQQSASLRFWSRASLSRCAWAWASSCASTRVARSACRNSWPSWASRSCACEPQQTTLSIAQRAQSLPRLQHRRSNSH